MRAFCVALVLIATAAFAQQEVHTDSYWDRCYGSFEPRPAFGSYYYLSVPIDTHPTHTAVGTGPAPAASTPSLGGSGAGSGYALLVMAVVAVAALPAVIYALDGEPPPRVLRRFQCPSFAFDGWGGVEGGGANTPLTGIAAARLKVAYRHFGTEVQFSGSGAGVGSFSVHGVLRPTPKEHLEVGLALGYRRVYFGAQMREGLELGVPQQYTLWRNEGRELQLELRPGVFITTQETVDVSLEVALLIPVLEAMSIRLGTRVFSYDLQPAFGASGGLSLHL